jgi:enoyl-CoA hydratase
MADAAETAQAGPPLLQVDGAVARITLNRPAQANRLEPGDLAVLAEHVATVNTLPQVLVLQLCASGRHFCSGFEIGRIGAERTLSFEDMVNTFEDARPVTIAVLQGGVYGGATDLALACDFRIGTPAVEMFMPAARLGLVFYPRGLQRYVSRLGVDSAKRLFLTAARIDAPEMHRIGFLTQLVSAEALQAEADALATTLGGMAPIALLAMKQHLNAIARGTLDTAALQHDLQRAAASSDLQEGITAFAEKRTPRFTGR